MIELNGDIRGDGSNVHDAIALMVSLFLLDFYNYLDLKSTYRSFKPHSYVATFLSNVSRYILQVKLLNLKRFSKR